MNRILFRALPAVLAFIAGCVQCGSGTRDRSDLPETNSSPAQTIPANDPLLARPPQDGPLEKHIIRAQESARATDRLTALGGWERLGWLFVAKARESFDDSYYKLAEQCALRLDELRGATAGADLLRGHVLHNLHQFKKAEMLARRLAGTRGAPFDHGLLGDVLMEQGRLNEAADAYQKMMDLRPDSRALARAAHMRWLRGDLPGAVQAMQTAILAVGSRETESAAWMNTRLGYYHWASGNSAFAEDACAAALRLQTNFAPALALLGRIRLAAGESGEAIELLERATRIQSLPENQWWLTEALLEAGRFDEARATETELRRRGAAGDARTFALFLATRREQPELTISLMQHELQQRADVFTHDALAWSLASAGRLNEARDHMERALSEGTRDARLFFHAAVIATKSGQTEFAAKYAAQAKSLVSLLMPSEQAQLSALETKTARAGITVPSPGSNSQVIFASRQ